MARKGGGKKPMKVAKGKVRKAKRVAKKSQKRQKARYG